MEKLTWDKVPDDVPEINKGAWLRQVNMLMEKAQPGNWAWHKLQNDFGFDGDWTPADVGEPPQGAEW